MAPLPIYRLLPSLFLLASLGSACQPPTPSFSFNSQPSSFSQHSFAQPNYKQSFSSYTPGYSHDSYSQPAAPVAAPPPPPIPPSSYAEGLESFSGKLTSGVATGEGTYPASPPAAYAKYGKSSKQFIAYPGYVPPPPAPEENLYPQVAPQPPPASSPYMPPLNLAGLQGLSLPSNTAYPQLLPQQNYQQSPSQYPTQSQQQMQQFASYAPQQQQPVYDQKLVPGQMFNGNSMVPHYQQVPGAAVAPSASDCSVLSLSNFPQCVENKPSISQSASALMCTFEQGSTCRFDVSSLNIASMPNPATKKAFSQMMGRSDVPEGAFAYQLISHPKGEEITLGTAVICQRGNGVLKLNYWLSNPTEIDFKVCTQDHLARSCTQPISYSSSSSVVVEVVHPNATVFDVEIVAASILHPILFVVNSIEYRADLCEDEKQPAISGSSKSSSFFEEESSSSSGGSAHAEKERTPRGEEEDGEMIDDKPEDQNRSDRAFNAHPPTLHEQFQVDPAEYDHETSVPASEDVAYENSIREDEKIPTPPRSLKGPPRDPFKGLAIRENQEDKTFPPSAEPSEPEIINSPTRRLRIRRLSVCNLLDCSFDRNMCNYANFMNNTASFGQWSVSNKPVGNIHTGIKNIKDRDGFLYVGSDSHDNKQKRDFVLESPSFILPEDTPLSFDFYRRSNDVCFDTLTDCPYLVPLLEKDIYWMEGETVTVPKEARKIFFVATQRKPFKWLAIDNIQLKSNRC